MQMTDQLLSDADRNRMVGAVLLDFSAASVIWSSAAKKELDKLQLEQNRAARLAAQQEQVEMKSFRAESWSRCNFVKKYCSF